MKKASGKRKLLLSAEDVGNKLRRIAFEILEKHPKHPLAFVGIHTRGVTVANRVYELISKHRGDIARGTLDISLYRDDLDNLGTIPSIKHSDLPFSVEGAHIVLFDDVLFTGRTIRAAIDDLIDYGRPARIELAVLIDRGNRELPIAADYTGQAFHTAPTDHIKVLFQETDGEDGVYQLIGREEKR